jgi:hypothetical protein
MTAKVRIRDRMIAALRQHGDGGQMVYHRLAEYVFPKEDYPNAWNYPTRGGPAGCFMVLSRAIREHGFWMDHDKDAVVYSTVGLPRGVALKERTDDRVE